MGRGRLKAILFQIFPTSFLGTVILFYSDTYICTLLHISFSQGFQAKLMTNGRPSMRGPHAVDINEFPPGPNKSFITLG